MPNRNSRRAGFPTGLILAVSTFACARGAPPTSPTTAGRSIAEGTDVTLDPETLEAVYRWMMSHASERHLGPPLYFLEAPDGTELREDTMMRFSASGIRAQRRSSCTLDGFGTPMDSATLAKGVILIIKRSTRGPDGRIDVEVAFQCGELCGEGGSLILESAEGRSSRVSKYGMRWIS